MMYRYRKAVFTSNFYLIEILKNQKLRYQSEMKERNVKQTIECLYFMNIRT